MMQSTDARSARGVLRLGWLWLLPALFCLAGPSAWAEPPATNSLWSFKPAASLEHYGIYQSNPFFSMDERHWMETTLRFGGKAAYGRLSLEAKGIGLKTTGRDPYGSGSAPAGAPPGAERVGLDPEWDVYTLYLQWENPEPYPWKVSLGRQPLAIGTQFLIGEGVYDGYHHDFAQAVWSTPRNWFDAARLQFDHDRTHVEGVLYRVHPTEDAAGFQTGYVGGFDVSHQFESIQGTYGAGVFYRDSESNLDNDMWVMAARFKQSLPKLREFYVAGELVAERGTGRNPYYVTVPDQDLHEYAGHAELGYEATQVRFKPAVEIGGIYYSSDFTPLATGFSDWDTWYLGNQIVWIVFGSNTRILRAKASFWPHEKLRLLALYNHTDLVSGPSGTLSDEWTLIADWYPTERIWVSFVIGYSKPGDALRSSRLSNFFSSLNSDAVPVGSHDSVDLILGFGLSY